MVSEDEVTEWPQEDIPDADRLLMRVHATWRKKNGSLAKGAFANHNNGMSMDWHKYATPQQTRRRAKTPGKNAVVAMSVGKVRGVPGQRVEHTPDVERHNRAHSDVFGDKDEEARVKLRRIAKIVIPFDTPVD